MTLYKSLFLGLSFCLLLTSPASAWRSSLYPENWTPGMTDAQGRFLHDFSYAGYHQGEQDIPVQPQGTIYDVTQAPYSADSTGVSDATAAIQRAIDDAGAAGGGIVFLPAGTFAIAPRGENAWSLCISQNGVVVRGAGAGKTFICNTDPCMRKKDVILFRPPEGSWSQPLDGTVISAAKDIEYPAHEIKLDSVKGLNSGDIVILRNDCTRALATEFGMEEFWTGKMGGITFCRKICAVNTLHKTITIDIPTRFALKKRDYARIYKVAPHLEECGLEDLSIGMVENPAPFQGFSEFDTPGNGSYDMHGSHAVRFQHARNGWIQRIETYKPHANKKEFHLLSNGIELSESSQITVQNCWIQKACFKGNGGNGYGITLRGNDCLIRDCIVNNCRHNYDLKSMTTSGNVFLRCTGRNTSLPSDFHMHMSVANLFDSMTVENGDWLSAVYRKAGSVMHGHCTTESVFWNSRGNGGGKGRPGSNWHWDGTSLVCSSQWGWGYVIGTSGSQYRITCTESMGSAPLDFAEGEGLGETLEPQSLYEDQLQRRLSISAKR